MRRLPLLVFDLDGVLVDVRLSYRHAIVKTVAALGGGRVRLREIQAWKDRGGFNNDWDLSRALLARAGRSVSRPDVIATFNRFYLGANMDGLLLGERWMLSPARLAALGRRYRLAIFTGRPRTHAEIVLRRFKVERYFCDLVGLEDVRAPKPAPQGLLALARRHAPARVRAYLGDLVDDARCARAAGIPFIGVSLNRKRLLRAEGAVLAVSEVATAADWLLRD